MKFTQHLCTYTRVTLNTDTQALSHSYLELKGVGDLRPRNVIQEQNEQNKTMNKTRKLKQIGQTEEKINTTDLWG